MTATLRSMKAIMISDDDNYVVVDVNDKDNNNINDDDDGAKSPSPFSSSFVFVFVFVYSVRFFPKVLRELCKGRSTV